MPVCAATQEHDGFATLLRQAHECAISQQGRSASIGSSPRPPSHATNVGMCSTPILYAERDGRVLSVSGFKVLEQEHSSSQMKPGLI